MKKLNLFLLSIICLTTPIFADEVKHVNAKEAVNLMQQEDKPEVLDIRTAKEFAEEHIMEASNVDFQKSDFEQKLSTLDKNRTYLIHCRSGSRSKRSLKSFNKLGFQKIIHLDGGIKAWKKARGQTVK